MQILVMSKKESRFQKDLIDEISAMFPGSIILKNDPNYIQGIPDLTIFYKDHWATLECKKSKDADHQPNQDYYVDTMNRMSYSSFVYPENKEEVLNELQQTFKPRRSSRLSRSK